MKIKKIILISFLAIFMGMMRVDAASLVITAPSSADVNSNFKVSVKHSGETIGSLQMSVSITNAECSVQSTCNGGVANCNGGSCLMSFNLANGLKAGSDIITLNCHSSGGTAKFVASIANNDAWDVEGLKQISVSKASKSVEIKGTTTTKKKTTTQTTISKRPTTRRTTTSAKKTTTKKTTTKKLTTKKTTSSKNTTSTVSNKPKSTVTTIPISSNLITSENYESTKRTDSSSSSTTTQIPDDLKLSELKIVGYNIDFKPNLVAYTINVGENVDELYVIAEPIDEETKIDGTGVVDIKNKDFIQIKVYNDLAKNAINYKINIRRIKNAEEHSLIGNVFSDSYKLITLSMVGVIFALIVFFTIRTLLRRGKEEDENDNEELAKNEEFIPTSEEELRKLFDELEKEQKK